MGRVALEKHLKKGKQEQGFTLVELITVVAIISMIAIYITIEINRSSDDAKVGIATAYLASSVPAAISSYRARHRGNCNGIGADAMPTLIGRGLSPESPWGGAVTATYSDTARTITISFTIPGGNGTDLGNDLIDNLRLASTTDTTGGLFEDVPTNTTGTISAVYNCA